MMEQYLDGPEVDVDVVLNADGDVAYGNVTDNWPTIEPYFNETGGRAALHMRAPCMHALGCAMPCRGLCLQKQGLGRQTHLSAAV